MKHRSLSEYVKQMRKQYNLTQIDLSEKSSVELRFVRELEQVIFSWITGADMHLKNFSLYSINKGVYTLTPAYDMLSTMPEDTEELALNLNEKKRKLKKSDFVVAMKASELENKIIENIFNKFNKVEYQWMEFIDSSFLSKSVKERYKQMIRKQTEKIKQ